MGFCLYGNDIDDHTSPIEAGLGWITKFTKEFINSGSLQKQKEQGVNKKLVGFELLERGIPRNGYAISDEQGGIIGNVTSGTMAPSIGKAIGMGYVNKDFALPGTAININIRDKTVAALVHKLPFYNN
jgi:aminomethyltransferase